MMTKGSRMHYPAYTYERHDEDAMGHVLLQLGRTQYGSVDDDGCGWSLCAETVKGLQKVTRQCLNKVTRLQGN